MGIKIGFTGTQRGMTKAQKVAFLKFIRENRVEEFHHGDCIGADADAHEIVDDYAIRVAWITVHPPTNETKRAFKKAKYCETYCHAAKPYIERNKNIVNETETLIACPGENDEQLRSGTWSTVRYARKQNKSIYIIFPDGSLKVEAAQMEMASLF